MRVTGVIILASSCVGLNGSHYLANTRHIRLFGAECRSMVISALYGAVPLAFRGFYEGFDGLACCFCGSIPYLLRLFNGVEVLLIGTN